ncbi:class E sortase [Enemella sp. A6]|uniref:class E sortase n=1 Tax=Enemella sp. A6 TaxID=3440152 RepID=UPI003EBAE725
MASRSTKTRTRTKRRRPSVLGVFGILLLIGALIAVGWLVWQYFGSNITARQSFDREIGELRQKWDGAEEQPVTEGGAVALLRVPAFGDDYEVPILRGTDTDTLKRGVGMYPTAVNPGEIGNLALAGHRVTRGEPFRRLLDLEPGDEVIVETKDAVHTYAIDTAPKDLTVQDADSWVLFPVPGKPDQEPTEAIITLTTAQDLFRSADRSVAFGHLISTQPK